MARTRGVSLEDVLAASRDQLSAAGRRSPLFRWMLRHHDELAAHLAIEGANWVALAHGFGRKGLLDRTGKPPTPERARKTWLKVRQTVAEQKAAGRSPTAAPGPMPASPPLPGADDPERPKIVLRPGRFRSGPEAPPAAERAGTEAGKASVPGAGATGFGGRKMPDPIR